MQAEQSVEHEQGVVVPEMKPPTQRSLLTVVLLGVVPELERLVEGDVDTEVDGDELIVVLTDVDIVLVSVVLIEVVAEVLCEDVGLVLALVL